MNEMSDMLRLATLVQSAPPQEQNLVRRKHSSINTKKKYQCERHAELIAVGASLIGKLEAGLLSGDQINFAMNIIQHTEAANSHMYLKRPMKFKHSIQFA